MSYPEEWDKFKPIGKLNPFINWFCEWLCLVESIIGILTFCRFMPDLEMRFLMWYRPIR